MKLSCAVLLLVGCGMANGKPTSPGELDSIDLAPSPGWPDAVATRSVPASFRTEITALDVDPRGKVWLLRGELSSPSQLDGTPVLVRYAPTGHLERRIVFPARTKVSSFAIHPSGALSVFVMHDDDGDGLADAEGLYLLAEWTYGFKLYRLDGASRRVWGAQVMPANIGMAFQFSPSLVARGDGAVYLATQIFQDDVHIYGEHFGRGALSPLGSYHALVQKFDADGSFAGARLFGGAAVDHPSAMAVRDGTVLIAGAARITKHDAPNRTMEWDIAMMRGRVDDASALEYRTIDLSRDDFGWAMAAAPDGRLIVGERTDYVQVDTNSEVENGKGLLLLWART